MLKNTLGKRVAVVTASLALCASIAAAAAFADTAQQPVEGQAQEVSASDATMQDWGEKYPLEWNSYHQKPVKADGKTHGHYDLQEKLLAPVVRDSTTLIKSEDGYYQISGFTWNEDIHGWVIDEDELGAVPANAFKMGCYSCKTSAFDAAYEQWGAEIFTEDPTDDFINVVDGQVWDCATCHDGDPATSAPDAQLTYWTQLSRDSYDTLDAKERMCGQCHNSLDYRSHITDQETMDSFSPYKYGFDIDSLYDAAVEDGIYSVDEETGLLSTCFDHLDVEFTQGSAMRELGVTCVDCHMPTMTDEETGQTYTDHGASNSPLENETALEYCLTCHSSQGIETTDQMVEMVRGKQAEAAEAEQTVSDKLDQAKELFADKDACARVDADTLDQLRSDWSHAEAYLHATKGSGDFGVKVAHNPSATMSYMAQAETLLDGIIDALS